ncbi:MAG TPA: hypothetical protein VHN99_09965, partial [Deinococcales bacterium]|nr:hypothetical protein [Deinococcales bacterium]
MTATEPQTTRVLRAALLGLAALGTLATPVELLLLRHTGSKDQLIPFFLLALALVGIPLVWFRPNATNLRFFQVSMVLVTLGSFIGIYEHLKGNLAVSLHGMAHLTGVAALWDALVN